MTRLVGIIKRRMSIGVAVSISETDFGAVPAPLEWGKGGPYVLCVMQAMTGVVAWAEHHGYQGKVAYFFENGHKHQNLTNRAVAQFSATKVGTRDLRYHSHSFAGKLDVRPLQAADLLAYEWYKELKRLSDPTCHRPMRRSLESLLEKRHIYVHLNAQDMLWLAAREFDKLSAHFSKFLEVN